jgi:bifunctional non-homologous end joining protein LigD
MPSCLDGEAVVLDEQGRAGFSALQARLDGENRARVVLYAFDLLFLDGRDLRLLPLRERRESLVKLVGLRCPIRPPARRSSWC